MTDSPTPQVVNTHHFGGIDKLPSNTIYIGRPSVHGNAHSSQDGIYVREECVALHRIDLYRSCINNHGYFARLKQELGGHDLACWCKNPKRVIACHGDNFLHVFSDVFADRLYDKTVLTYLMDDLRYILKQLADKARIRIDNAVFLEYFIHLGDVKLDVQYVLGQIREKPFTPNEVLLVIATIVVELELAFQEANFDVVGYRFNHVCWVADRFVKRRTDRLGEPMPPTFPLKRTKKKEIVVDDPSRLQN